MEAITKRLERLAKDVDEIAGQYEEGFAERDVLNEAARTMRDAIKELDSLKESYEDALNPRQ